MAPTVEVTIMAAEDLKNVATFGKMNLFAVAWIDPYMKQSTRVLRKAGKNPVWNDFVTLGNLENTIRFVPNACLSIQVLSETSKGQKVVGTARLPLPEIVRISPGDGEEPALVTLQLQRPSGRAQGIIRLSMRVTGDLSVLRGSSAAQAMNYDTDKANDGAPVIGIPVPSAPYYVPDGTSTSTGFPSLPSIEERGLAMLPYGCPPPYQGYPGYYAGHVGPYPGQAPYSYAQPMYPSRSPYPYVERPRRQNRSNSSLLLGLLGGALGGLILGDIIF